VAHDAWRDKVAKRMSSGRSIARYLTTWIELTRRDDIAEAKTRRIKTRSPAAAQMQSQAMITGQDAPDKQVSLTDPTPVQCYKRRARMVGYNVQTGRCEHHLIVAHEVTNLATTDQLSHGAEGWRRCEEHALRIAATSMASRC